MGSGLNARERRLAELQRKRAEIDAEPDPGVRRQRIAALLSPSVPWVELGIGMAAILDHVTVPSDAERGLLRAVFERCAQEGAADGSAILRTTAIRLLSRQPDRSDRDLLIRAVRTQISLDGVDVTAEMRGLALRALDEIDGEIARWIAAERLFDGDVPNQEPQRTAVDILARNGDHPLLLLWLDGPEANHPVEAASEAEAELAGAMPAGEWARRATRRLGGERPVETVAAAEAVTRAGRTELAPALCDVLVRMDDGDLFRAVGLAMAAARESAFGERLLDIVEDVPAALLDAYTEVVGLSRSSRRNAVLTRISARARSLGSAPH